MIDLNHYTDPNSAEKLQQYLALLQKWNKTYNLTAITDSQQITTHHLLDSLSINNYLQGDQCLDVGTGAGLPGIPLAIMNPDKQFTLLDSNGKKTRFCQQVKVELCLENIQVEQARIEAFKPVRAFSCITSRAFSSLLAFQQACMPLLAKDGILLAMKGKYPREELAELPEDVSVIVHELKVPGVDAERHLVVLKGQIT